MWKKIGRTYNCNKKKEWNFSHCTHPVVDHFSFSDRWRIYYSSRDRNNISRTSFIDVEPENPQNILYEHNEPIVNLGLLGEFDEFGIVPTSIIQNKNKEVILYYIGLTVKKSVPFENFIGAILIENNLKFSKIKGPILGKDSIDPLFIGSLCCFREKDIFRGYYMSGTSWEKIENKAEPKYCIKYAESNNGLNWRKLDKICIELKKDEAGICQSTVLKDKDLYSMWYCYRKMGEYRNNSKDSYKIGYAKSIDGISWERNDNSSFGIKNSSEGWDNIMTCYPWAFEYNNKKWIIYNGNSFGKTGFGFAVWEK